MRTDGILLASTIVDETTVLTNHIGRASNIGVSSFAGTFRCIRFRRTCADGILVASTIVHSADI